MVTDTSQASYEHLLGNLSFKNMKKNRFYLMEARCLMATSRAWTDSKGTGICPLTRASWSIRQLTMAIHLMETLNIRSLPSPGIVTSKSTCKRPRKQDETLNFGFLP